MTVYEATQFLWIKFFEEKSDITAGENADRYRELLKQYPVTMDVAHREFAKQLDEQVEN